MGGGVGNLWQIGLPGNGSAAPFLDRSVFAANVYTHAPTPYRIWAYFRVQLVDVIHVAEKPVQEKRQRPSTPPRERMFPFEASGGGILSNYTSQKGNRTKVHCMCKEKRSSIERLALAEVGTVEGTEGGGGFAVCARRTYLQCLVGNLLQTFQNLPAKFKSVQQMAAGGESIKRGDWGGGDSRGQTVRLPAYTDEITVMVKDGEKRWRVVDTAKVDWGESEALACGSWREGSLPLLPGENHLPLLPLLSIQETPQCISISPAHRLSEQQEPMGTLHPQRNISTLLPHAGNSHRLCAFLYSAISSGPNT
ncbi:hypothetical protein AAFF_G00340530 [Aldrovandia affinis]|uniref:Uncharacterized protein n=1 Tax=Aldrovandia affinis TaxID=143900 RepID=A0AAD7WPJ1_9TELE|nr:hypothetical protein AAFF_G00340530 [Aldrovandia affinis]